MLVEEKDIELAEDIFISIKLLKAARLINPKTQRVIPVSGSLYHHVIDSSIEIASITPEKAEA